METREEKFKKYREEIKAQENGETGKEETITPEDEASQMENYAKKNTLTMSIDQIIEAHDEYTTIIEQQELETKLRQEKAQKRTQKMKEILKYGLIGLAGVVIIVVLVLLIVKLLGA